MVALLIHRRRNIIVPKTRVQGEKILKLCIRCRENKTKCDALTTKPLPCSYCSKKNIECQLGLSSPAQRENDLTEKIMLEVRDLHETVDKVISRKSQLILSLLKAKLVKQTTRQIPSRELEEILEVSSTPPTSSTYVDPIPTLSLQDSFSIYTNMALDPVSISLPRAKHLLRIFQEKLSVYLPILPDSFFNKPLHAIHLENDLLFWSIMVSALLQDGSAKEYILLAKHVQNLVVVNCWYNTPRSLYSLIALIILTTWPLPEGSHQTQDSTSIKYISLMKSLSLQFGLHKLNFIEEFSKKTVIQMDGKPETDHKFRERIYKYVNINSNFWLVLLGLSTSNYNGFHQDYIINKAANFDIFEKQYFTHDDNLINSMLKLSLVQLKMNENMNDLIDTPSSVGKLINLNMFEQILDSFIHPSSPLVNNALIDLWLEYSKIQLYIYYLSDVDIELCEYKTIIGKAISSCKNILDIFESKFTIGCNYFLIPIHYRFSIELVSLMLLQLHSFPLLNSVQQYKDVKNLFLRSYGIMTNGGDSEWSHLNKKVLTIIHKFDSCNKLKGLLNRSKKGSYFLVDNMSSHLVSSLHYEMMWDIYIDQKTDLIPDANDINWQTFGLDAEAEEHKKIINYIISSKPILV